VEMNTTAKNVLRTDGKNVRISGTLPHNMAVIDLVESAKVKMRYGKKILIVDDDEATMEFLEEIVKSSDVLRVVRE
jgi:hypothetical protein